MSSDAIPIKALACLGSSCFARGNSENVAILQEYMKRHGYDISVTLTGRLCQKRCLDGPNLKIDGKMYHHVTPARLRQILDELGQPYQRNDGAA